MQAVRKAVAVIHAFAAFLAAVGLTAIVVGVHDASLDQVGFGVTAGSVLLIALGVTLSTAAYQLILLGRPRSWPDGMRPPAKLVVLAAFFLTVLVGIYILFAGLGTASSQWPVVVAVAVVLIVVSLLGVRFFGGREHVTLPKVGAAVVLGVIGTTIGAWEFWYQNQYAPSHGGRAVALSAQLHRDGKQGAYDVIRATVNYQDVGSKSVWVLGSVYTLTGSRVVRCRQPATLTSIRNYFDYSLVDPQKIRYMADVREKPSAVLAAGKFVGDGKHLDPDVSSSRNLVFLVPRHQYQLLRLRAELFAIPGSVELSQRTPPQYVIFPGDNELYGFWHLDDNSWFHDLVYGRERWVVVRYELVDVAHPQPRTIAPPMRVTARFPDPTWGEGRPSQATAERLFSLQAEETPGSAQAKPPPGDASEPFADTEMAL